MTDAYGDAVARLDRTGALVEGAVIVCERRRDATIALPEDFEIFDARGYGDTAIDFARRRRET